MRRRDLLALTAGSAISLHCRDAPRAAEKTWRVGYLDGGSARVRGRLFAAFQQRLRELGYVEGDILYEARYGEGDRGALPGLAHLLLASRPDALLVATTAANVAAKAATSTVPIVMIAGADPVEAGLIASLAKPGGNITGVTNVATDLTGKRLEIIKEIVPGATRIAVLFTPDDPSTPAQLRSARTAAKLLRIELSPMLDVRRISDFAAELAAVAGADAGIRLFDPLALTLAKEVADWAARRRLPVIYPWRQNVEVGGLVAFGTSLASQYLQAAGLMDKILKGAKPADLPVQQPTTFELVINLKTAKTLGLTVPQSLLARADEIIE
jgi:putative tryptophan/tyrosine transport system substrate-binding protein